MRSCLGQFIVVTHFKQISSFFCVFPHFSHLFFTSYHQQFAEVELYIFSDLISLHNSVLFVFSDLLAMSSVMIVSVFLSLNLR